MPSSHTALDTRNVDQNLWGSWAISTNRRREGRLMQKNKASPVCYKFSVTGAYSHPEWGATSCVWAHSGSVLEALCPHCSNHNHGQHSLRTWPCLAVEHSQHITWVGKKRRQERDRKTKVAAVVHILLFSFWQNGNKKDANQLKAQTVAPVHSGLKSDSDTSCMMLGKLYWLIFLTCQMEALRPSTP